MSSLASPEISPARPTRRASTTKLNRLDRRANSALKWLAFAGGAVVFITMFAIAYQVIEGATMAFNKYGAGFLVHKDWIQSLGHFDGGLVFIYGTLVTSLLSVIIAAILGIAIGLFLALMAPRRVAATIGPLVEMLAAVPSVVLGLIGVFLICPFIASTIEPPVHTVLGFLPIFGAPQAVGNSLFAASLVLVIMVVPIIAALTRDLFMTVPQELRDGAEALGCTRWEVIRGVVLPTTSSGVIAACVLGLGRAVGEAIAVSQVIGGQPVVHGNLFLGGNTLASVIALELPSPVSNLHISALFYCAAILFIFGLITNLMAQWISHRFNRGRSSRSRPPRTAVTTPIVTAPGN
ncbi:MAG: phosphate ABC transporter permease subunit PstC [Acidobacteriota bacterium]|nr:phosphate ABC transporter permease subunit PstC [Acidobacteriota bacterium]